MVSFKTFIPSVVKLFPIIFNVYIFLYYLTYYGFYNWFLYFLGLIMTLVLVILIKFTMKGSGKKMFLRNDLVSKNDKLVYPYIIDISKACNIVELPFLKHIDGISLYSAFYGYILMIIPPWPGEYLSGDENELAKRGLCNVEKKTGEKCIDGYKDLTNKNLINEISNYSSFDLKYAKLNNADEISDAPEDNKPSKKNNFCYKCDHNTGDMGMFLTLTTFIVIMWVINIIYSLGCTKITKIWKFNLPITHIMGLVIGIFCGVIWRLFFLKKGNFNDVDVYKKRDKNNRCQLIGNKFFCRKKTVDIIFEKNKFSDKTFSSLSYSVFSILIVGSFMLFISNR